MKRILFLILLVILLIFACSCKANTGLIELDEAKKIALEQAGVNEDEVEFVVSKLRTNDESNIYYDIQFKKDSEKFEYKINPINGNVNLEKTKITNTVLKTTNKQKTTSFVKNSASSATNVSVSNTTLFSEVSTTSQVETTSISPIYSTSVDGYIGLETAKIIALNDAAIIEDGFELSKADRVFDGERGLYVYNISFVSQKVGYEYVIKADDGEILNKNMSVDNQ